MSLIHVIDLLDHVNRWIFFSNTNNQINTNGTLSNLKYIYISELNDAGREKDQFTLQIKHLKGVFDIL